MNIIYRSNLIRLFLSLVSLFLISCGSSGSGSSSGPSNPGSLPNQDTAPSFSRSTGYFVDPITITLAAPTGGAMLRYTDDGSDPSCSSGTDYTLAVDVPVTITATIKAIFCKTGFSDSAITVATYNLLVADVRVDTSGASLTPIQDAIDAASVGDVVFIPAGTYTENNGQVDINKQITLLGQGSGTDPVSNTIVRDAIANQSPIHISVGGTSESARVAVRNMLVTGSLGTGNDGIGLEIYTTTGHIEIDNVTVTGNDGYGLAFDAVGDTQDILILNSTMSNNGSHGFRVPSSISNVDGLTIDNCIFENNTDAGAMFYTLGDGGVTNISITNSTFSDNATASYQHADLILTSFLGNLVLSNITIDSNGSDSGIRITGKSDGMPSPRGGKTLTSTISLSDITINGMQQSNGAYPAGAIVITRYADLTNLSMSNVVLNSTAPHGLFLGTITVAGPELGNLEFNGTFSDSDIRLGSHGNSGSYVVTPIAIDATGVTFMGATSDAEIEARVYHSVDDAALGLVSWTSP